ncbi:hypothetical protein ACH492_34490 [Streptomyces sp. NPDC019443]|uniref:hypothetical protein n=1 Tax=Streptomyces sp. NPDC019443 TaxID=3365061 RepID=UPI00379BFEA3
MKPASCALEVPPVRQLSAPGRLAVAIAASLAIAASAGCMSVSDDEGGKPPPRTATDRRGAVAEPDGGRAAPGGHRARGEHGEPDKAGKGGAVGKGASPSPSGTAKPAAKPARGGQKPQPPRDPQPTGGGASPSEQPPQPTPSEPPPVSPTPQPSEPSDPPPPSSAPEVHAGAIQGADGQGMYTEPAASPQVGPM